MSADTAALARRYATAITQLGEATRVAARTPGLPDGPVWDRLVALADAAEELWEQVESAKALDGALTAAAEHARVMGDRGYDCGCGARVDWREAEWDDDGVPLCGDCQA